MGIRLTHALRARKVKVHRDSQLVVGKVQGEYEIKDSQMKQYLSIVEKEKSWFERFSIQRVPQEDNEEADRLARLASSTIKDLTPGILVEYLLEPSIKK